jgi:molybdenum cofactor cytidylyltransferase
LTTALIPAAGESARLGRPKQLVTLKNETLVHRATRVALEAGCTRVIVIEGAIPLRHALADLPVELVTCTSWKSGPGASLKAGAQAAGDADLLVLLADQYAVTPEHLRTLINAKGEVAAAQYANQLGVPAYFTAKYSHVLRELPDGAGAKAWLKAHPDLVTAVHLPEAELDLDSPEQLAAFQD